MRKYTNFVLFSFISLIIFIMVINLKLSFVSAESTDPDAQYINTILNSGAAYNNEIQTKVQEVFPTFNIQPSEYNTLVAGPNNYRILEITPETYLYNETDVSDLSGNLEKVKQIYIDELSQRNLSGKYFITNMPNFEIETMTIKEFVDNRDDLNGKYSAIVFDEGAYTTKQVDSCAYYPETSQTVKIYDENARLRYSGGTLNGNTTLETITKHGYGELRDENGNMIYEGLFKNDLYHGEDGRLYQNGILIYSGSWQEGKRNCYGESYDTNGVLQYAGQWLNDQYQGYGKQYDVNGTIIYEGFFYQGEQSPDGLPDGEVLNDIINFKADEIINHYINKGLPVFFSSSSLSDQTSVLYQKFSPYLSNENVFTYQYSKLNSNNNINFDTALSIMKITELMGNKPNLTFTNKPVDFKDDPTVRYQPGQNLHFNFNLTNKNNADLMFYFDINQDGRFEEHELAYTLLISQGQNAFDFEIPTLYSGLLKYKIVVASNLKENLYQGTLNIKGEFKEIKVLNVVSSMVDSKDGLMDPLLIEQYFEGNGDYKITIDRCQVKDFSKNNRRKPCSHYTVMDNYDVILLGQDIFGSNDNSNSNSTGRGNNSGNGNNGFHGMNPHVYNSIQQQIDNGKPVIFTSSVTKGYRRWVEYFHDDLSLSDYRTDLYKINNRIDKLEVVNDNSFVLYPYNMNNEQLIVPEDLNYALNEQYQMNLDNENLVPLMNMYNSNNRLYDRFDSYNNYYYMKNGNVVYLNVGNNSFNVYKDIEHKLLTNSIINLYVQDKAKNQELGEIFSINYLNDYENKLIDITDPINFSFTVYSNQDDNYKYTVYTNSNIMQTGDITNNQSINVNLNDVTSPNTNTINEVYISVVIENSEDVRNTYGFYVFVSNLETYGIRLSSTTLNNSTILNDREYVETGISSTYYNTYQVELTSIDVSQFDLERLPRNITLNNLQFIQEVPDNITIEDSSLYYVNQTITKTLGDYTYTLIGDEYVPDVSTPIRITIPFKVNSTGDYTFAPAKLSYNGIGSDFDTIENSSIEFTAIKPLIPSMVNQTFNDYLFIPYGIDQISDLTKRFSYSDEPSIKSIQFNTTGTKFNLTQSEENVYTLLPIEVGTQSFEIVVTDIFNNTVRKTFEVRSYVPIESLNIDDISFFENDTTNLTFDVDTENISYEIVDSFMLDNTSGHVVDISQSSTNSNQLVITAQNVGYVQYRFSGYNRDGHIITKDIMIVVNPPLADIYFINSFNSVFIGDVVTSAEMQANVEIIRNYTYDQITWSSSDETIVSIDSQTGEYTAVNLGTAVITGTLPDNTTIRLIVKVFDYISDSSGFKASLDLMKVYQGYVQNLEDYIELIPSTLTFDDVEMTFTFDDPNGLLEWYDPETHTFKTFADKTGTITIHVTITQTNGTITKQVTDTYTLLIREIVDPNIDSGDNQS